MSDHTAGALATTLRAALAVALVGTAALALTTRAAQAATPDFDVTVVTANGSGCPDTTATARILPDGSSFAVDFGGYLAWAGGGAPSTAFRRNCQFTIRITRPDGLTYAVEQAEYSGFALLADGMTGVQAARYYFQGGSATTAVSRAFVGPLADTWESTHYIEPGSLRFAPCNAERDLNVNTELRLRPQPATADTNVMVMDPSFTIHLTWNACG